MEITDEDIQNLKESMEEGEGFWWIEDKIDEWVNNLKQK